MNGNRIYHWSVSLVILIFLMLALAVPGIASNMYGITAILLLIYLLLEIKNEECEKV